MPPQQTGPQPLISIQKLQSNNSSQKIEVGRCNVNQIGLEKFIRAIVKEINLHITDDVYFNLNDRGVLYKWKDVFNVEKTYTKCLGIQERLYRCKAYTHEVDNKLAYFILEEFNKRSYGFLPDFKFHVLIFCWYDKAGAVTKVSVQYDQMSFFLHCLGAEQIHRFIIQNLITPPAKVWANAFLNSGFANPFTFLLQVAFLLYGIAKLCTLE